jgi:uncharacterized protein
MNNIEKKTVLITGASSGIGQEIAEQLGVLGHQVILVARSGDKLDRIITDIRGQGGKADFFTADLTDIGQIDQLVIDIRQKYPVIDVLINNAGVGWYGYFEQIPWDVADSLMMLNMFTLVKLTHAYLPEMKARNAGQIINISSIIGDLPVQGAALYSSSKAFVNSFTKAVARELSGTKVRISLIKPGPVATKFFHRASEMKGRQIPGENFAITVDQAARKIISIIGKPKKVLYIPGYYSFMPWIDWLFSPVIDLLGPILLKDPAHK